MVLLVLWRKQLEAFQHLRKHNKPSQHHSGTSPLPPLPRRERHTRLSRTRTRTARTARRTRTTRTTRTTRRTATTTTATTTVSKASKPILKVSKGLETNLRHRSPSKLEICLDGSPWFSLCVQVQTARSLPAPPKTQKNIPEQFRNLSPTSTALLISESYPRRPAVLMLPSSF